MTDRAMTGCPQCGFDMIAAFAEGADEIAAYYGGGLRDVSALVCKKEPRPPAPGDFTVCLSCHEILRFGGQGKFTAATEEDFKGAPVEFIETMAKVVRAAKRCYNDPGYQKILARGKTVN